MNSTWAPSPMSMRSTAADAVTRVSLSADSVAGPSALHAATSALVGSATHSALTEIRLSNDIGMTLRIDAKMRVPDRAPRTHDFLFNAGPRQVACHAANPP